jgi:hypothetical protein
MFCWKSFVSFIFPVRIFDSTYPLCSVRSFLDTRHKFVFCCSLYIPFYGIGCLSFPVLGFLRVWAFDVFVLYSCCNLLKFEIQSFIASALAPSHPSFTQTR